MASQSTSISSTTPDAAAAAATTTAAVSSSFVNNNPSWDEPSMESSCTTLVFATLVTNKFSDSISVQQLANMRNSNSQSNQPILAHAEPIWKRRRVLLCLSIWALLAVAVIAVSASLALTFTGVIGNGDDKDNDDDDDFLNSDDEDTEPPSRDRPGLPSLPPVPPPDRPTDPVFSKSASHAVSWGKVSTCEDPDYFLSPEYDLSIRCGGGRIEIRGEDNAKCEPAFFSSTNITDPSGVHCRLRTDGPSKTDDGRFYQEATATVLFACIGETHIQRSATAELPDMIVKNCTGTPPSDNRKRRNLRTVVDSNLQKARDRAVQSALIGGGAAAFMSIGRFCRSSDNNGSWALWSELYPCEQGKRIVITALGDIMDGELPDITAITGGDNNNNNDGGSDTSGLIDLLDVLLGGGRQLQVDIEGLLGSLWVLADLQNFCYNLNSCRSTVSDISACDSSVTQQSSPCIGCNFLVPAVRMNNGGDSRESCFSLLGDGPSVDIMWTLSKDEFIPSSLIDRISGEL